MNAQIKPALPEAITEYSMTERGLAELRERLRDRVYDVSTGKGMEEAKRDRAELRTLRVDLEKKRKEIKAPALEYCQRIDSEAKRITAEIVEMEQPIDDQIKAEEQRKEQARIERERAELARLSAITQRITALQAFPLQFIGAAPDALREAIEKLEADALDDMDETHLPNAQAAKDSSLATLRNLLSECERLAQEREALEAARREQEAAAAEARAIAEREEAERKAAQAAEDARRAEEQAAFRAEQERIAAEQAERQRQLDAQAAEQREREQQIARERMAEEARQRAEEEAAALARAQEAARLERERAEAEAAQRREHEELVIREATLASAAADALALLKAEGYGDRLETRALESALSREVTL